MDNRFWSGFVKDLEPYVPGEQPREANLVKLNTNENPYGPSPAVLSAIEHAVSEQLRLYPPPGAEQLKGAISHYYGLEESQVFVGNGSDEVLAHTFNGLLRHDQPILFPDITYSFYPVYCGLYGISYEAVAVDDELRVRVADYARPNGGVVLANPNAPTGCLLALQEIEQLLQANTSSVVVVDEAYIDFGGNSAVTLINQYDNLLVVQTLSKSRSLAGLRVGLALGNRHLIEALERVKNSFNSYPLDRLAIAGGLAAFADEVYFRKHCALVIASRERLVQGLTGLGFAVIPSAANFVFVSHPDHSGAALTARLREEKILVRHFSQPRIEQYIRITVGSDRQIDTLLSVLAEILS